MTDTTEGSARSPANSPLIVDLTGRMKKKARSQHARQPAKSAASAPMIYVFPARQVSPPAGDAPSKTPEPAHSARRFPRWLRSLTAWHGLIAGAIACYVLIVCNLIYGLTSMAQLKVWRPLQGPAMSELQRRALTAPVECEQSQLFSAGGVAAVPLASVLCSADKTFTGALEELFPRRNLAREPRALRVH